MILITTIHDPNKKLINDISRYSPEIKVIFDGIYICVSDATDRQITEICSGCFSDVKVIKKNGAADARRKTLMYALDNMKTTQQIMYCDFDRLLTWIKYDKEELTNLVNRANQDVDTDYLIVGRTKKAFATHPSSWRDTEVITNKMSELAFGIEQLDITAGAAIFTIESGEKIAKMSKHSHTDCEWPKIIFDAALRIGETKVNGLCYMEINSDNTNCNLESYAQRLELSKKITLSFLKVLIFEHRILNYNSCCRCLSPCSISHLLLFRRSLKRHQR